MTTSALLLLILLATGLALYWGARRARRQVARPRELESVPIYHGVWAALVTGLPALVLTLGWAIAQPPVLERSLEAHLPVEIQQRSTGAQELFLAQVRNVAAGVVDPAIVSQDVRRAAARLTASRDLARRLRTAVVLFFLAGGLAWSLSRIGARFRARRQVERILYGLLAAASSVALLTTIGIVLSLIFEAVRFFRLVSPGEFFLGLEWSPQTALRADQVGSSGAFGAVPLFVGTLLITVIAMCVAAPIGLLSAIYLAEYAGPKRRATIKPALEILAGIPTVVYGFFAALTVAPWIREVGARLGLSVASESALAAGLVMGFMIIPFVSSLSDDALTAVPRGLREASVGLGASRAETIRRVVVPAALPGIAGGLLLAVSRAIGETMIVVMAAGLAANLSFNPIEAVTTVTVQIVTLLVGDQEFDSAKTLAAFALGLTLFAVTLVLNAIALVVVRRYRERYE